MTVERRVVLSPLRPVRNAVIGIALGIAAILIVALLDGAFQNFLPALSDLRVGPTNLAPCAVLVSLAVAFVLAGYLGQRWHSGVGWVLLPVVVLYARGAATAPHMYGCNPMQFGWACTFVYLPFVVAVTAACVGYVLGNWRARYGSVRQ